MLLDAACSPPPPTLLDAARARARRCLPLLASLSGARPGLELGAARLRRPCRTPRRAEAGRCRRPRVSCSLLSPPRSSFSLAPPLLLPNSRPRGAAPPPSPDPYGHRVAGRPPPAARGAPARARRGGLHLQAVARRPGRGSVCGSPSRRAAPPSPGGLASRAKAASEGIARGGCRVRRRPAAQRGSRRVRAHAGAWSCPWPNKSHRRRRPRQAAVWRAARC